MSILFHYFIQPVSLMFCGHLGKSELASVAMALSVIYISCISIGRGLAFGEDTFFSQTYGSTNKKKMGIYLQKGLIFGILCTFFIWSLIINTEKILLLLRQEPEVARMAQLYIEYFMPGALAYCWIFTLMRYLLCQNSVLPNLLICMASCAFNALLHYLLVYVASLGIRGSAISLALTYYIVLLLLVSYIYFSGIYRETWPGWSRECLENWSEFGKVAVSSIFMTFIFWFCTEVGTFLAGLLSEQDISAFSICFQVEGFVWMIPLGIGSASTARIGQYLGAKKPMGAITTCRVALTVQGGVSVLMASACFFLRYYIPMAFTQNEELIDFTGRIMPIVSIFLLLEGFGGVGISIVRGTGRQTLGAVIIFISFYVFALPIGIPLMFVTNLGLAGLWWGYVIGIGVQNICLFAFVARMNWQKETDQVHF
uniref:Multidrug and toxin extrusion protein n=1 Tax=Helobdella robusta TaxID=6412 RepID=T1FYH1_HELRO